MAARDPEEKPEKVQADFVKSAVRHVRYGPESLSEFTQWRVCPHPTVLEPRSLLFAGFCGSELPWRSLATLGWGAVESVMVKGS